MTAREALKKLREKGSLDEVLGALMGEPLKRAIEALEREAAAEEKAKPKVTLEEQVRVVDLMRRDTESGLVSRACPGSTIASTMISELAAAADTIRRLDEEGPELLKAFVMANDIHKFLRSIGVEPKP